LVKPCASMLLSIPDRTQILHGVFLALDVSIRSLDLRGTCAERSASMDAGQKRNGREGLHDT
jgi:hypothetical protein